MATSRGLTPTIAALTWPDSTMSLYDSYPDKRARRHDFEKDETGEKWVHVRSVWITDEELLEACANPPSAESLQEAQEAREEMLLLAAASLLDGGSDVVEVKGPRRKKREQAK